MPRRWTNEAVDQWGGRVGVVCDAVRACHVLCAHVLVSVHPRAGAHAYICVYTRILYDACSAVAAPAVLVRAAVGSGQQQRVASLLFQQVKVCITCQDAPLSPPPTRAHTG